jgi:cytochrome c-type biogenesis protein CcmH/NrfG
LALGNPPQETLDAADELLRDALATHPSNSGLLAAMANLRQHQGEYDAANELYKRALFLNPDDVEALSQLAHILGRKTDSTHAASAYIDRALRIAGPRAELVAIKGMTYFYKGRPEEGLDLLKVAASTAHANPKHQFYYALALAELSELDKAREVWRGIAGDELDAALSKDERQSRDSLQQLLRKP